MWLKCPRMGVSIICWARVGSIGIAREERQPEGTCAGAAHCMLLSRVIEGSVDIVGEKHPEGISAGAAHRVCLLSFIVLHLLLFVSCPDVLVLLVLS